MRAKSFFLQAAAGAAVDALVGQEPEAAVVELGA
jgi:hypothetical protein